MSFGTNTETSTVTQDTGLQWGKIIPGALSTASTLLGMEGANTQAEGTAITGEGAALAGVLARQAGERMRVAKQFEAEQLEQQGVQLVAAAQRAGAEEARKAHVLASRAVALAAASGAGVSDPSIVRLISKAAAEGSYRRAAALYGGKEAERMAMMGAAGKRYEGEMAAALGRDQEQAYLLQRDAYNRLAGAQRTAGRVKGVEGAAGMFAKYGAGGFGDPGNKEETAAPATTYGSGDDFGYEYSMADDYGWDLHY